MEIVPKNRSIMSVCNIHTFVTHISPATEGLRRPIRSDFLRKSRSNKRVHPFPFFDVKIENISALK